MYGPWFYDTEFGPQCEDEDGEVLGVTYELGEAETEMFWVNQSFARRVKHSKKRLALITELELSGFSPKEIVEEIRIEFSDEDYDLELYQVDQEVIKKNQLPNRKDSIVMELQRLDALINANWIAATNSDRQANQVVIKCIQLRMQLLGLSAPTTELVGQTSREQALRPLAGATRAQSARRCPSLSPPAVLPPGARHPDCQSYSLPGAIAK